jgi:hypothetical protein
MIVRVIYASLVYMRTGEKRASVPIGPTDPEYWVMSAQSTSMDPTCDQCREHGTCPIVMSGICIKQPLNEGVHFCNIFHISLLNSAG